LYYEFLEKRLKISVKEILSNKNALFLYFISIMPTIRITKEFTFEASHILKDYDGLCRNIHGHSYKLIVTISGTPIDDPASTKNGMVMDFGDLKKIVKEEIVDKYDHSLVANIAEPLGKRQCMQKSTERLIFTPFQPTCENLVAEFAAIISARLPKEITLKVLRLYETANSFAEWYEEDNK
jgi:6-pyruvoyltetrahydropterin/6-carboxytetrahydropterin synthase